MNPVGRPKDSEMDRVSGLAKEYFVSDDWSIEVKCWDDGDVHIEAYSTLGVGFAVGYPSDVHYHRQIVRYKRDESVCNYINAVYYTDGTIQDLNRFEISL